MNVIVTLLPGFLPLAMIESLVAQSLGQLIILVICGAAVFGLVRLVLATIKAAKTPAPQPIQGPVDVGYWGENSSGGTTYRDGSESDSWGWNDTGGYSSSDDCGSSGGCDGGGCDGGGGDGGDGGGGCD